MKQNLIVKLNNQMLLDLSDVWITMKDVSSFEGRIAAFFEQTGREQKALAAELGVTPSLLSAYKLGRGRPSIEILEKMARIFGVSLDWLILGKKDRDFDLHVAEPVNPYGLQSLFQKIRRLPPDQQALIEQTVDAWLASSEAHRKHSSG